MRSSRRDLLRAGAVLGVAGLAGCNDIVSAPGTGTETPGNAETASKEADTPASGTPTSTPAAAPANAAVAAEWNAMRARVWDALALGLSGEPGAGASVARATFRRFEAATGEYGAHEVLERTSEANYAEFEEALGELRTEGLEAGDLERAREEATIASTQLREAQRRLLGERAANAFDLQSLGTRTLNAAFLADVEAFDAAGAVAEGVLGRFEEAAVHDALESTDSEAYEAFEGALENVIGATKGEDADAVRSGVTAAYEAALRGSYALADAEKRAGAGHLATLQARGWDAAALSRLGGPARGFAHATTLNVYRARIQDARWLADRGETERAGTVVADVFAHFEGAKAHDALESADAEAYEAFESGLSDLQSAIEQGSGIADAVSRVDSSLVSGIEVLAGANAPLLEAGFFRARFQDARERYELGETEAAASIARSLFERFEANELGVHETVESTSEEIYARFEEEHLASLIDALSNGNDEAVGTHYEGVQTALLDFETAAGSEATVSGAEATFLAARGFDAAVLAALGERERAKTIAQSAFEHFEGGAGGYHEALESADHEAYEAFESALGSIATAATGQGTVYGKAKAFGGEALASVYAIVASAGGSHADAAASLLQDVFAHFENARVHEALETADHEAYEAFESALNDYVTALREDGNVRESARAFARASLRAQFAVAGAVEKAPIGATPSGGGEEPDLSGGPNVVDGVPEDADHVIDMKAVSYDPAKLTVAKGDTVAWRHAAGEPHSVTAYEDRVPDGAAYWASGGFDSQTAAETGWENGKGAVQSGQAYVHTFETTGTHEYFCIPHEAAGMTGTIVVK